MTTPTDSPRRRHRGIRRLGRTVAATAAATAAFLLVTAPPAAACGGLLGENGTIQLVRTATLAAYHDGVEHYVTAFEFTGEGEEVGSIVPLPGVPSNVEKGGDWTLQRLSREVAPLVERGVSADAALSAEGVEILEEVQIDALDITILRGGGDEVGEWALANGFLLPPDAPEVLEFYAGRSPVFMAARFDADAARQRGQGAGDATPIHLTIPTDEPWVPLRILGLGLEADQLVEADVFLLTDDRPDLLVGGPGIDVERSERASELLLSDLRSDRGMEWVPDEMWLSYLPMAVGAADLDYDLAISAHEGTEPSPVDAGLVAPDDSSILSGLPELPDARRIGDEGLSPWAAAGIVAAVLGAFGVLALAITSRERRAATVGDGGQ